MFLNVFEPEVASIERFLVSDIKANNHTLGVPVVHSCYLSEAFLTCGIPDEKTHKLSFDTISIQSAKLFVSCINLDSLHFKIIRNRRLSSMLLELLLHESVDERRFTDH